MEYPSDDVVPDYVPLENRGRWRELWTQTRDKALADGDDEALAEVKGYVEADSQFGPNVKQEMTMAQKFKKFIRFVKLEEAEDGGAVIATGIATSEAEDSEGERCHYPTTKPWYQKWSAAAVKRSQGKSLGNVREQHDSQKACGKLTGLEFDDDAKRIMIRARIIDPIAMQKCMEGVYSGWSHGGSYVKQWKDEAGNLWYTANPSEISAVDNPANPDAAFETVDIEKLVSMNLVDSMDKSDGECQYVQKNGTTEITTFAKRRLEKAASVINDQHSAVISDEQLERVLACVIAKAEKKTKEVDGEHLSSECFAFVGDKEKTDTWKLPYKCFSTDEKNKSHVQNALARFDQTEGIPEDEKPKVKAKIVAAAKKHGIEVSEKSAKALAVLEDGFKKLLFINLPVDATDDVKKGMWEVSDFAQTLQDLYWICVQSAWEREREGDDSEVPDELKAALKELGNVLVTMVQEEVIELTAEGGLGGLYMSTQTTDLEKGGKGMASHLKKAASHHEGMAKIFKAAAEKHDKHAEQCQDTAEGMAEKSIKDELAKAANKEAKLAILEKSKDPVAAHFAKAAKHEEGMSKCMNKAADEHEKMAENCSKAAVAVASEKDKPSGAGAETEEDEDSKAKGDEAGRKAAQAEELRKAEEAAKDPILKAIQAIDTKIEANKTELEKQVADLKKQLDEQIEPTKAKQTLVGRNGNEISKTAVAEADDSGL
jgi:hypothetical protein